MDKHFGVMDGVEALIDDIVVHGRNREEHDKRLTAVLEKAQEIGIKFNADKLIVGADSITYAGHVISADGIKPDPNKVKAIKQMPTPKTKEEVRSFLGMVNYLRKFFPKLSEKSIPLRELIKKNEKFVWGSRQEKAFQDIKDGISESATLAKYDVEKPIILQVDASSKGLGACIIQDGKPIAFGSSALTSTQAKYAQIEKECLAILYGCRKFHQYLYGKKITVQTDHKPLEAIFKKDLDKVPPRISRMILYLMKYDIEVKWIKGKEMLIADALSRINLQDSDEELDDKFTNVEVYALSESLAMTEGQMNEITTAMTEDAESKALLKVIEGQWPDNYKKLPEELRIFWGDKDEFHMRDGLILKAQRIFIPKSLREIKLAELHEAHLGVDKMLNRARETVYWPKMTEDIKRKAATCEKCAEVKSLNEKQPLIPHEVPFRAWQKIGLDLLEIKRVNFLVCVDYYSSFIQICKMTSMTTEAVVAKLKEIFMKFGIPEQVFSDNGPQFVSEDFKKFAEDYKFETKTSSPRYPQSNGKSESAVKIVKNILMKARDVPLAIMEYNATPMRDTGKAPAMMMFGRNMRTKIPCTNTALSWDKDQNKETREKLKAAKKKQKENYDVHVRKDLKQFKIGEKVWVKVDAKRKWIKGTIVEKFGYRSYAVEDATGSKYRRNRKFIRKDHN